MLAIATLISIGYVHFGFSLLKCVYLHKQEKGAVIHRFFKEG